MSHKLAKKARQTEPLRAFTEVPQHDVARAWRGSSSPPIKAFQSPQFLVAVYADKGHLRLTVNRTRLKAGSDRWDDDVSWDDLQRIKSMIGLGDAWAVEVFPPDSEVVNVANMRHLWVLAGPPQYGWHRPSINDNGRMRVGAERVPERPQKETSTPLPDSTGEV